MQGINAADLRLFPQSLLSSAPSLFPQLLILVKQNLRMAITLEHALLFVNDTFQNYAKKDGNCATLSKEECIALIQNELPHICGKEVNKATCERLINEMNTNKDDCVDFPEYVVFLARVCMEFKAFFNDDKSQQKTTCKK